MKRIILVGAALAALLMACDGDESEGGPKAKAPISSIALVADGDFTVGTTVQLHVVAARTDLSQDELTEGLTFASSDDTIATVDPAGLVTVIVGGPVSFTATAEGMSTQLDARTSCEYPHFAPDIVYGRTMPMLSWPAKQWDGTDFQLDMANVYCDKEWKDIDTLIVVTSAMWCNPCKLYAQQLATEVEELEQHRTKILYVIGQDPEGTPNVTRDSAYSYMDRIINTGRIPGMVVGDSETAPVSNFVQNSSQLQFWPSVFVVRTRDMKIIASGNRSDSYLPLESIADNPEKDWGAPGSILFHNECASGQDEDSEPNDTPAQAAGLDAGTYEGGICSDRPDLYQVQLDGNWEFKIEFDATVGDLDLYVWDAETNAPAKFDGQVVGSTGSTGVESFEYQGRVIVGVVGYDHASAPYTLTLTEK